MDFQTGYSRSSPTAALCSSLQSVSKKEGVAFNKFLPLVARFQCTCSFSVCSQRSSSTSQLAASGSKQPAIAQGKVFLYFLSLLHFFFSLPQCYIIPARTCVNNSISSFLEVLQTQKNYFISGLEFLNQIMCLGIKYFQVILIRKMSIQCTLPLKRPICSP